LAAALQTQIMIHVHQSPEKPVYEEPFSYSTGFPATIFIKIVTDNNIFDNQPDSWQSSRVTIQIMSTMSDFDKYGDWG
jgi:hypothetical protein